MPSINAPVAAPAAIELFCSPREFAYSIALASRRCRNELSSLVYLLTKSYTLAAGPVCAMVNDGKADNALPITPSLGSPGSGPPVTLGGVVLAGGVTGAPGTTGAEGGLLISGAVDPLAGAGSPLGFGMNVDPSGKYALVMRLGLGMAFKSPFGAIGGGAPV